MLARLWWYLDPLSPHQLKIQKNLMSKLDLRMSMWVILKALTFSSLWVKIVCNYHQQNTLVGKALRPLLAICVSCI